MAETVPKIIHSPLGRTIKAEGHRLRVEIYRAEDSGWILEVVDKSNASTVWDEEFKSDEAAYQEFERTLREEGVNAILEAPSAAPP